MQNLNGMSGRHFFCGCKYLGHVVKILAELQINISSNTIMQKL